VSGVAANSSQSQRSTSQPAAATAGRDVSDAVYALLYQLNAADKASNYSIINRRRAIVAAVANARRR